MWDLLSTFGILSITALGAYFGAYFLVLSIAGLTRGAKNGHRSTSTKIYGNTDSSPRTGYKGAPFAFAVPAGTHGTDDSDSDESSGEGTGIRFSAPVLNNNVIVGNIITGARYGIMLGSHKHRTIPIMNWPPIGYGGYNKTYGYEYEEPPRGEIQVGEIIGWRAWTVKNGNLCSLSTGYVWDWEVPSEGDVDTWGIFALKTWDTLEQMQLGAAFGIPVVFGSVYLWGEIVEHEWGYRAQYAVPRTLDLLHSPGSGLIPTSLKRLRRKYGMDPKRH
jgi:hypothetical protein